jgi:hypothetical protein
MLTEKMLQIDARLGQKYALEKLNKIVQLS